MMNNIYRCNVALGGDIRHVVIKDGVTVPEIAILKHIHSDAVTDICFTGKQDYASGRERTRLTSRYGEKVENVFGVYGDLPLEISSLNLPPSTLEPGAEPIGRFPKGGTKKVKKQVTKHMEITEEVPDDEPVEAV